MKLIAKNEPKQTMFYLFDKTVAIKARKKKIKSLKRIKKQGKIILKKIKNLQT